MNGQDDDQEINDEWSELNHYPGMQFRGENEEVMKDIATKEIDDHVFDTNNIETSWQFKKKQNKEIRDEIRKKKDKQGGKSKVKFVE